MPLSIKFWTVAKEMIAFGYAIERQVLTKTECYRHINLWQSVHDKA